MYDMYIYIDLPTFDYIRLISMEHVGIYTSPMDPYGS